MLAKSNAGGSCIRNTVASLMSNSTTIAESQINSDVRKQREKEMNVLLNRFTKPQNTNDSDNQQPPAKQTQTTSKLNVKPMAPPPAPPMPASNFNTNSPSSSRPKRKSVGK